MLMELLEDVSTLKPSRPPSSTILNCLRDSGVHRVVFDLTQTLTEGLLAVRVLLARKMQICINNNDIRAGSTVTGVISFAAGPERFASDFQVTLALKGVLHTSISTSTGVCEADKSIYSRTTIVSTGYGHSRDGNIEIPFAYEIPTSCPPSTTYSTIAQLDYAFYANISDLTTRICIPLTISKKVIVLAPYHAKRYETITKRQKRITYTASPVLFPGESYFLQLSYPSTTEIRDYKVTLSSSVRASHASASFSNKTERPFRNPKVITRKAFDNSTMTVLDVKIPDNIEYSIDIVGLTRQYTMHVYLVMQDQSIQTLDMDVEVIGNNNCTTIAPPASQTLQERRANKTPLRDLSMNDLANKALALDIGYRSDSSDQSSSLESSKANKDFVCDFDSPPSSPKSSFSLLSSRASRTSGSSNSPPTSYHGKSDRPLLKLESLPETPAAQMVRSPAPHQRHKKTTSTMSVADLRPRMASISKFAKKLSFGQKTMEFSCCGPEDEIERPASLVADSKRDSCRESRRRSTKSTSRRPLTPENQIIGSKLTTIETSTSILSSPSSTYSSPPRTPNSSNGSRSPTRTVLARKLSDSLNATLKMGKRSPVVPAQDERRFSISSYYLGGNNFTFQGISALDIDGESYDFADDSASALGFAV